jgi:hypothetical protein
VNACKKEAQRIDAALAALGGVSSDGSSRQHTMSAAARRKISLAQKGRWAKQRTARSPNESSQQRAGGESQLPSGRGGRK